VDAVKKQKMQSQRHPPILRPPPPLLSKEQQLMPIVFKHVRQPTPLEKRQRRRLLRKRPDLDNFHEINVKGSFADLFFLHKILSE
jgi:hypothetical protein